MSRCVSVDGSATAVRARTVMASAEICVVTDSGLYITLKEGSLTRVQGSAESQTHFQGSGYDHNGHEYLIIWSAVYPVAGSPVAMCNWCDVLEIRQQSVSGGYDADQQAG